MTYVELVIRIPEDLYKAYKGRPPMLGDAGMDMIAQAISNGTPLPKGYGNLIDTKEFIESVNDWVDEVDNYGAYEELEIAKALLQNHAHTIIEADKESEG